MFSLRIPTFWILLPAVCLLRTVSAGEAAGKGANLSPATSAAFGTAASATGSGSGNDAAVACFEDAKKLFKDLKFKEAADKFREAYTLKPSWKLLYNIGQSEAAAKQYGLALEAFEQFLSEGGDDISETRRDEVLAELDRLRKMVGFLTVNAPLGASVFVDDEKRGTAPVRSLIAISAGVNHAVRGELNGTVIFSDNYKVIGGQTMEVDMIKPLSEASAGPSSPTSGADSSSVKSDQAEIPSTTPTERNLSDNESPEKKSPLVLPGFVVAGVGAAAVVTGAVLGGLALSKNNDLTDACGDHSCPDREGDVNMRDNISASSTALIAAGGTVFAGGVVMIIVGKIKEKKNRNASKISILPVFDGTSAGACFERRF